MEYRIGTSGYSFEDWVGNFYPAGTQRREMFAHYLRAFRTVELNFTYYRMPVARTLESIAGRSGEGFTFWVKANQQTTHRQNRAVAGEFIDGLAPMIASGKLAGVLLQFPQSFHRTVANRQYLAAAIDDLSAVPLAAEFRHRSWDCPETLAGLRERSVTLAVPDAPALPDLYRPAAALTTRTGYLRLHSRNAGKWYAGAAARYDYNYSREELTAIAHNWAELAAQADRVYAFFNNCHGGQAAANAQAFEKILEEIG